MHPELCLQTQLLIKLWSIRSCSFCRFLNPKAEYAKDAIDSLVKIMFEMLFASADNVATQVCTSAP